jgi:hypothetical protein
MQQVGAMVEVWKGLAALCAIHFSPQSCYNEVITKPELLRKYKNFRRVIGAYKTCGST